MEYLKYNTKKNLEWKDYQSKIYNKAKIIEKNEENIDFREDEKNDKLAQNESEINIQPSMLKKADTILNYAKKNDSKEIENNLDSKNNGEITKKRGVYKKYTIDEKLKYLDYLNKGISKKEIYRTYGISENSL